jgi:hypothetical protein
MHNEISMIDLIALRLKETKVLLFEIDEFCFAMVFKVVFEEGPIKPILVNVVDDDIFLMYGNL